MQRRFSNCTTGYKAEYSAAWGRAGPEEVADLTCRLVHHTVDTCGELWRACHTQHQDSSSRAMLRHSTLTIMSTVSALPG